MADLSAGAPLPPRVEEQLRIAGEVRARYFGHMRLRTNGRETDVLLGAESRTRSGLTLIDWRTAPLAEVFFGYGEGEDYGLALEGRHIEGKVLQRNLLAFRDGELSEIATPSSRFVRDGRDWRELPLVPPRRLTPRSGEERRAVVLDDAQRRAVDLPAGRPLLLLGEAGAGKTTVALHRLVKLRAQAGKRFRAAVVVPTAGLRGLSQSLLERLEAPDVDVFLYDTFAGKQARKAFRALPRRESVAARASVIRLKRHEAVRAVLDRLPLRRGAARNDLHELFGDKALLREVVERAGLPLPAIDEVFEHTRVQFSNTTEQDHKGAFLEALETVDGRAIDEGTTTEDAGTIDVEDYAVLFEIDRARAARLGEKPARGRLYDCIVVDEAQELSPFELALIGRSLAPKGTLIVAGDQEQQIDEDAGFRGWENTMRELGAGPYDTALLEVSYRCPPAVTAFARELRAGRPGHYPCERLPSDVHLVSWLVDALQELIPADRTSSAAVICRSREGAVQLARALRHGVDARLALDGAFSFRPGIEVTCVEEVKGLEFDHVIVPDAGLYVETAESRRALYVAATRASHELVVASGGRPTPLVV